MTNNFQNGFLRDEDGVLIVSGSGGSGTVESVTAGDDTITVGGTDSDPTIAVTADTFAAADDLTAEVTRAETAEALKLAKASNLSDLADAGTARTNLGLGTAATSAATAFDAAGAATTAQAAAETAVKAAGLTRVFHGSTASTARPSGWGFVEWIGSVEPDNIDTDTDTWIDTSSS